jgi:uncharacterized protein with NRDE domain
MEMSIEAMKQALNKAFQLGQRYWSWADSEYSSHWKKADVAKAEFDKLVEETCQAIEQAEKQEQKETDFSRALRLYDEASNRISGSAQREWVGLTDEDVYPLANDHLHFQIEGYEVSGIYNLARAIDATLKEKNT